MSAPCPLCKGRGIEPPIHYAWRFREQDGSWSDWYSCTREEYELKSARSRWEIDTMWSYANV